MFKLIYINIINFVEKYISSLVIIFFICGGLICLFLLQFEIIMYFYPDVLLLNLNEIIENEINLSLSNKFHLLKGYVFADPHIIEKTSIISTTYGIVKYKKYRRNLKIMRMGILYRLRLQNIRRNPFNKFFKKYKRPLFIRYLYYTDNRNQNNRLSLLENLLSMSSFTQKLWLLFWEYTELSNYRVKKRKFYRRLYILKSLIHSFPKGGFYYKYVGPFKVKVLYVHQDTFKKWNLAKNYNTFNIYKKFSKHIYINFFDNTIEPFRFYEIYKRKRKGPGLVFAEFFYDREAVAFDYWDAIMRGHTTERLKPINFWRDPKGFGKHKMYFATQGNKPHKYRFRFTHFYNEKYLMESRYNSPKKFKYLAEQLLWKFNEIYFNYANRGPALTNNQTLFIRLRGAYDLKSRGTYWFRAFTRYGYRKKDYYFKNFESVGNFKKFYISSFYRLFAFPDLYKNINFFDFLLKSYLKLNNYFNIFFTKPDYFFNYSKTFIKRWYYYNNNSNKYVLYNNLDNQNIFIFKFFYIFFFPFIVLVKLISFFLFNFFNALKLFYVVFINSPVFSFIKFYCIKFFKIVYINLISIIYNSFMSIYFYYYYKLYDYFNYIRWDLSNFKKYNLPWVIEYYEKEAKLMALVHIRNEFNNFFLIRYTRKAYRYLKKRYKKIYIFFFSDYLIFLKKTFSFSNISYFFTYRLFFYIVFYKIFILKSLFAGLLMYFYWRIIYLYWRVLNGYQDIYTWEHMIYIFLFGFITMSIISNPHIYLSFFNY